MRPGDRVRIVYSANPVTIGMRGTVRENTPDSGGRWLAIALDGQPDDVAQWVHSRVDWVELLPPPPDVSERSDE